MTTPDARIADLHTTIARTRKAYRLAVVALELARVTGGVIDLRTPLDRMRVVRLAKVNPPSDDTWRITLELLAEFGDITQRVRESAALDERGN